VSSLHDTLTCGQAWHSKSSRVWGCRAALDERCCARAVGTRIAANGPINTIRAGFVCHGRLSV